MSKKKIIEQQSFGLNGVNAQSEAMRVAFPEPINPSALAGLNAHANAMRVAFPEPINPSVLAGLNAQANAMRVAFPEPIDFSALAGLNAHANAMRVAFPEPINPSVLAGLNTQANAMRVAFPEPIDFSALAGLNAHTDALRVAFPEPINPSALAGLNTQANAMRVAFPEPIDFSALAGLNAHADALRVAFPKPVEVVGLSKLRMPTILNDATKISLTARALTKQVSILGETHTISPLVTDLAKEATWISTIENQSNRKFLESPVSSAALVSRLNKLPSDFHLVREEKTNKQNEQSEMDLFIKNKVTNENILFTSAVSSFGVLDVVRSITENEVISFYNYLAKYPMLGLNDDVGKKIFDWVKKAKLYEIEDNTEHFRARLRAPGQTRPYTEPEMWEAPYGLSGHGRFNPIGQGVLYTSSRLEGAAAEVLRGSKEEVVDIIKWISKEKIQFLDLVDQECPLFNYCEFSSTSQSTIKPEYLIPNFLAQCCRAAKIQAIRFTSTLFPDAYNYVFLENIERGFEYMGMTVGYSANINESVHI
ncbi:RES family NAD+ phosphorylase [Bacillus sp. 37MA]|uniref:RES family NAD+ phosphorylase n=1 Tax=Bacillus sp. 37MA TaxID=1132442 RepID=UPI00035ED983|nr:RES family NAD+ phosphorylase [Bacillus sp. 37MA]